MYDVIIVGAGIAGLYSAYTLKKNNPEITFKILEGETEIGGRAQTRTFQNTSISTGAGIGRKKKDKLLMKLLNELQVEFHEFPVRTHYASSLRGATFVKDTFFSIKKKYETEKPTDLYTFRKFAHTVISEEEYSEFVACSGYTDYENEDIESVLYHYGFDDNFMTWTGVGLSWKTLNERLMEFIGPKNVKTSCLVEKIDILRDKFLVHSKSKTFTCRQLILATTIESVMKLLPGDTSIYRQIHGQPFLRIYGQFDKASIETVQKYIPTTTIVPGPIHKIIPIKPEEGIYMIAYTDNIGAKYLKKYSKNKGFLARLLETSLGCPVGSLKLIAISDYYWEIGTHYYSPLVGEYDDREDFIQQAQNPYPGCYVVGEMVSLHQGWVEGALQSCEILRKGEGYYQ